MPRLCRIFALIVPSLAALALSAPAPALGTEFPVLLRTRPSTTGQPVIEIRQPGWRGQVWTLHLPAYLRVYGHTDDTTRFTATRNTLDGSVVVSGVKTSHGRIRFTFILTPGIGRVDIRATVSNFEKRPLDPGASAGVCLTFEGAAEFADSTGAATLAVFGDSLVSVAGVGHVPDADTPAPRRATYRLRPGGNGALQAGGSLILRSSGDGARHVAIAWSDAWSVGYDLTAAGNPICSNPLFGPVRPGESKTFRGCIYLSTGSMKSLFTSFVSDFPGLGYQDLVVADGAMEEPFRVRAATDGKSVQVTVARDTTLGTPEVKFYRRIARGMPYFASQGEADDTGVEPEMIHEGRFAHDSTLTWTDTGVNYGDVAEYWVVVNDFDSRICTVRVRDPRIWWGTHEVDDAIDRIREAYGDRVSVVTRGETVDGWPLRSISTGNPERVFVLIGGVHPGESGPEFVLPVFERLLENDRALLGRVGVAILPLVNADTRERLVHGYPTYLRTNARDVDLNRNFDAEWRRADNEYGHSTTVPGSPTFRGDSPASEPETRAVVDFVQAVHPVALFSLHGPGSQLLYPSTRSADLVRRCREVAAVFQNAYAGTDTIPGRSVRASTIPGTLSRWALEADSIPAFDQECDGTPPCKAVTDGTATLADVDALRERNYRGLRALLVWLSDHPQ